MIAFLIYILKSSFCLALLYGFYRLLFASTTRFSLNRWILTGGMLTCLLLPFISLELEHESLVQSPFICWGNISCGNDGGFSGRNRPLWVACIFSGSLSVGMCLRSFTMDGRIYPSVPLDKSAGI